MVLAISFNFLAAHRKLVLKANDYSLFTND